MEGKTLTRRFEVWHGDKCLMAAHGLQVCADFIDGTGDGRPLPGCKIRHVEGWMNYVDGEFEVVSVIEEFSFGLSGQKELPL